MEKRGDERECRRETAGRGEIKWRKERGKGENVEEREKGEEK